MTKIIIVKDNVALVYTNMISAVLADRFIREDMDSNTMRKLISLGVEAVLKDDNSIDIFRFADHMYDRRKKVIKMSVSELLDDYYDANWGI